MVAFFLIPTMAIAQEKQIVDIRIVGNEHISKEAISAAIPVKPGIPYSEKAVQDAKTAIENMGYFDRVIAGTEPTIRESEWSSRSRKPGDN